MRVAFYHSDKDRELYLAAAFLKGAARHKVETIYRRLGRPIIQADIACMVGVKSANLFREVRAAGQRVLYFDKGYVRSRGNRGVWEYWRVALDAHQPTEHLMDRRMKRHRWDALGLEPRPWRKRGDHVIFAGSSAKYHEFHGLPHPTTYAASIVAQLRQLTDRPIIYRPKPSWKEATPLDGVLHSGRDETLLVAMEGAHAIVTHGSNACFDAALMGIPSIVLGDAVARPISSTDLAEIETPRLERRDRWFRNLAFHQWTESEMESGEAWQTIQTWL